MQIACTRCDAQHEFPTENLGEAVVQVRCAQCGHVFGVRRPAPAIDEPASFEMVLAEQETYEQHPASIVDSATGDDLDTSTLAGLDLQAGPREAPDLPPEPAPAPRRNKALPVLLMLQVTPASSSSFWKSKLPYWLPRSEW